VCGGRVVTARKRRMKAKAKRQARRVVPPRPLV